MMISTHTPTQKFEIWAPRWKDVWVDKQRVKSPVVLLAKQRIGLHNEVVFTKTKAERFKGSWYIAGTEAKNFPIGNNGAIECYEIPFDEFEPLERIDGDMLENLRNIKRIFGGE